MGVTTPASLKSLMVALTSAVPPGMRYCSSFTIFLGRGSPNSSHLAFPTVIALTPQVRESVWGWILPDAEYVSSNYTFWNCRNNHRMGLGTHWAHCEMDLSYDSIDHLTSINPYSE